MASVKGRLAHAWNAFLDRSESEPRNHFGVGGGVWGGPRPDRHRTMNALDSSIINSILLRIALDAASVEIRHVRLDDQNRYSEDINSGLNNIFSLEGNIDQTNVALLLDFFLTVLERGHAALVPIDTDISPITSGGFDILSARVGIVTEWFPTRVRVEVYNDRTGNHEQVTIDKSRVVIMENPFYNVMNEQNSTLQRVVRKLGRLDAIDRESGSGKLDILVQVPYQIKTENKQRMVDRRKEEIELQLSNSRYGIGYVDSAEKIIQLNRPVENNLMGQIEYLMGVLYGQMGITAGVMDGTADEKTMLNYDMKTVRPLLEGFVQEVKRKFLTKTARTQKQSVEFYRDPFKLLPMSELAELADKLTRNEVLSSNEMRQAIGLRPSTDPKADQLRNSNMPQSELGIAEAPGEPAAAEPAPGEDALDALNTQLDELLKSVEGV